jgi:hypothetical protein
MNILSDVIIVNNIQAIAFTQRALCSSVGQFLAIMSGFAVMVEFGNAPLTAEEIEYLISFWEMR